MMRCRTSMMLVAAMLLTLQGAGAVETEPAAGGAKSMTTAKISGTIKTAAKIVRICAVDREWADVLKTSEKEPGDKFLYEGTVDEKGNFSVGGLLPGRTYDLIIWTQDASGAKTRWEGVCMDYHRVILPAKEAATDDDKKWLADFVKDMPSFYDKSRSLHMAADHKHATLLVELARTRDFHSGNKGEVIYRVELWYFENLFGGWAKDKNTERVVARVRGKPEDLEKNWQFMPALGGIAIDASGASEPVKVELPEKADVKNGLAGQLIN